MKPERRLALRSALASLLLPTQAGGSGIATASQRPGQEASTSGIRLLIGSKSGDTPDIWRWRAGEPVQLELRDPIAGRNPRLRLNLAPAGRHRRGTLAGAVTLGTQCPEWRAAGSGLVHDGDASGALQPGPAAWRVQIETEQDDGALALSGPILLVAESPLAVIRRGLEQWPDFAALTRAVAGGRRDLVGSTFEVTPGMFAEGRNGLARSGPGPVARLAFPCTLKALDPERPPVFLSVTGERDILQVEARDLDPIDGEVVLQDLVFRDNRSHHDTGEAGVRLKDRWPGRSVRIERCEFVRCQNAVAGGALGQRLTIADCRIVDCGLGGQAHGVYVGTEWLDFHGNRVLLTPGNRLARAHLLKCRSLHAKVLGNRFEKSRLRWSEHAVS